MKNFKKKQCGCNKPQQSCGCKQELNNCSQYKQAAQEKCEKAECVNTKANRIAQEAMSAERRAEALKEQAHQECKRANELWAEYNRLVEQGLGLMQQAENYLAKGTECYASFHNKVDVYDLSDCGCSHYHENTQHNCNCGCK